MTENKYELDIFEEAIVKELHTFHQYDKVKALEAFLKYKPVLDLMDRYFNPDVFAKSIHDAVQNNIPLEHWLEHVKMCEAARQIPIRQQAKQKIM